MRPAPSAGGYCRGSTGRQEQSIPGQLRAIKKYCDEHGPSRMAEVVRQIVGGEQREVVEARQRATDDLARIKATITRPIDNISPVTRAMTDERLKELGLEREPVERQLEEVDRLGLAVQRIQGIVGDSVCFLRGLEARIAAIRQCVRRTARLEGERILVECALPAMTPWRTTLRTLRPRFAAGSSRHGGLLHVLGIAAGTEQDRLDRPPFGPTGDDRMSVLLDGRMHPLCPFAICGSAIAPRVRSPDTPGQGPTRTRGYCYRAGFFGCGDHLVRTNAALKAFDNLAGPAWRCLPARVRAGLVTEPYLDPAESRDNVASWVLGLHALAWNSPPGTPLKADRVVYCRLAAGGQVKFNLESLFRLPDSVPVVEPTPDYEPLRKVFAPSPRAQVIAERLTLMRQGPLGAIAEGELEFPPGHFAAFLEPDLFLASALAIDALLDEGGAGAKGGPNQRPAQPSAPYRAPQKRTRAVSISAAAKWFKMHRRTLQRSMREGRFAAAQMAPRLWVFDLDEVGSLNPKSLADADPDRYSKPARKAKKRPARP